ncbi:MAG: cell division protein ZapA [Candidatus Azobacteroides sp.]|nr:cell division protein ZapA [Candidatus Azobacteroides sp.]
MNSRGDAMDENFKIQLKLGGKYYPYKCKRRSDEGMVRKAASNLSKKIDQYALHYSKTNFDVHDILTLVGFHFSLEVLENEKREDMSPLFNKIDQLNQELEEYIKSFKR